MVIYLKNADLKDAKKIADDLKKEFQDFNGQSYFRSGAPVGMLELRGGIGYGHSFPDQSNGMKMSEVIATAKKKYDAHVAQYGKPSEAQSKAFVREAFQEHNLTFHEYHYNDRSNKWFDSNPKGRAFGE